MVTPWDVRPQTQTLELYILNNLILPWESTADDFSLNGNTTGFDPQTQKLE